MAPSPAHRREQILDEAQKLFVLHGVERVTTRQIASAVGISQPSLYAHFPTRDAIAVELCRRAFEALNERLNQVAAQGGRPSERLERLGREYIAFGLTQDSAYRVAFMLDMPKDDSAEQQIVVSAGVRAFGVLLRLFEETHGEAAPAAAQSAWASLHGLVALLLARKGFPWVERQRLITQHLDALCRGAGFRPPPAL